GPGGGGAGVAGAPPAPPAVVAERRPTVRTTAEGSPGTVAGGGRPQRSRHRPPLAARPGRARRGRRRGGLRRGRAPAGGPGTAVVAVAERVDGRRAGGRGGGHPVWHRALRHRGAVGPWSS